MLKKIYFWILSCSLIIILLAFSQTGKSYDDQTTHPGLTDEIVDFYNLSLDDQISGEEKEWIVRGSIEEDTPPRWINHFYDPTTGEGWLAENLGRVPPATMRFLSKVFFNLNTDIVSSVNWLHNEELQAKYADYGGNNTWENAIRQYAKGDKKEAYLILGHILHLLEDKTVPDHTRNDTHAHEGSLLTADGGSPYEDYSMAFTRQTLTLSQSLNKNGQQPIVLNSIDQYFENLANYSNKYFFSEHTINSAKYSNPKILKERVYNNMFIGYGKNINGEELPLVNIKKITDPATGNSIKVYSITDKENYVLQNYFSRLTSAAVLNGAGVIKLFKEEADKAKADSSLLKPEPKVSWWQENLSPYYSSIAFYNQIKTTLAGLFGEAQETGGNLLAEANNFYQNNYQSPALVQSAAVLGEKIINTVAKPIIKQNPLAPNPASAQIIITKNPSPLPSNSGKEQTTITIPGVAPRPFPIWLFGGGPTPPPPPAGGQASEEGNGTTTPLDTTVPNLTILNAPAPYISTTSAEFEFTADETPIRFACRLDGGDWQACQASTTFENLAEGNHLLEVIAIDAANNQSVIASSTWLVDITAPTATIIQLETEYAQTGFTVEWSGEDIASTSPQPSPSQGEGASGLAGFDLEYMIATSSSPADGVWQPWLTATSATSSIFDQIATSGDAIYIRVRAADRAGNIGVWSEAQTKIFLPIPPPVAVNHLVISEVQTAGATANDEFIELYNPTDSDIDLSNYSIQYRGGGAIGFNKKNLSGGWSIKAKSYFLITHNQYAGIVSADISHSSFTLSGEGGTIFLVSNQIVLTSTTTAGSTVVDRLAYGNGANLSPENSPAPAPVSGQSLERKAFATSTAETMAQNGGHYYSGNGYDSDNNSADFVLRATPEPQNSSSLVEPREPPPVCRAIPSDVNDNITAATLTASRDPYCVSANQTLNIPAGQTLIIEPGTIIKFNDNASLSIFGELKAVGAMDKKITFTSIYDNTLTLELPRPTINGSWLGLSVMPGGKLTLDYAQVSYVGNTVWLASAKPKIVKNKIRLAVMMIKTFPAIAILNGQAQINHSEISRNDVGIQVCGNSDVTISNSAIAGNFNGGIMNAGTNFVTAINNWWGDASGPRHTTLNPGGLGDSISNNVLFDPWLTIWP